MTTFTFSMVDDGSGTKASVTYDVSDEEGKRILSCYCDYAKCKDDPSAAFSALAKQMMQAMTNHVCAYERANAASPIVPKQE